MYCDKCGKKIDEGSVFCPGCGAKIAPVYSENNRKKGISGTGKKIVFLGIAVFLLAGIGLMCGFVFFKTKNFREYMSAFRKEQQAYPSMGKYEDDYEELMSEASMTVRKYRFWDYVFLREDMDRLGENIAGLNKKIEKYQEEYDRITTDIGTGDNAAEAYEDDYNKARSAMSKALKDYDDSRCRESMDALGNVYGQIMQMRTDREILQEFLTEELTGEEGIFEASQSGVMHDYVDEWFHPDGILSAYIYDFDKDGKLELLVCHTEEQSYYSGQYPVILDMYEVEQQEVRRADSMPFCEYTDGRYEGWTSHGFDKCLSTEIFYALNLLDTEDKCYFLGENYTLWSAFADGKNENYWAFCYDGEEFQYELSFWCAGGSGEFTFHGCTFEDGQFIESRYYYNDIDAYEGGFDFDTAFRLYFGQCGIKAVDGIRQGLNFSMHKSVFECEGQEIVPVFVFENELTSHGFSGDIYTCYFSAHLERGGEELE